MKKNELLILKDKMLEYLKNYGYSNRTIAVYDWDVRRLIADIHENEKNILDFKMVQPYLEHTETLYKSGKFSKDRYISLKRTCRYFFEFCNTGAINFALPKDDDMTPYFLNLIKLILTNPDWNESRKKSCRYYSRTFFKWLIANEYEDLSGINESLIRKYFIDCTKRMNNKSLSSTRYYLKLLFNYLYDKKIITDKYESVLTFIIPIERKVQRPTPQSEISTVLATIDRSSSIGKRNYAMIMTALKTGLRQCDIVNLKLSDIDWRNGTINITQSKTGIAITLPLTKDYGEAIFDYILNGRKKCKSKYVFILERPPFDKLCSKTIYSHFNKYRQQCGLPLCSFHGVRRMLGSSMVAGGVSVDLIPDILGHSSLESIRPYIFSDSSTMMDCALTLDSIPNMKR